MIKGAHVVRVIRPGRPVRWYIYAWRGGPQVACIESPTRPRLNAELAAAIIEAQAIRVAPRDDGLLSGLIRQWRGLSLDSASPEWKALAPSTRKTWGSQLTAIEKKWGNTPLSVWNDPRMVAKVVAWRDSRAETPRAADIGVMVLRELMDFGRLRSAVLINVARGIPTLYRGGNRAEIIWTDDDIAKFIETAKKEEQPYIGDGLRLAALTGLRRQDLVTLTWANIEEFALVKKALKSSRRKRRYATVPRVPELNALLDELRDRPRKPDVETVLVNSYGRAWTGDGFGGSFNRIRDLAGIVHADRETGEVRKKHLHDVRGTFATRLILAGLTDQETAEAMAWSPEQVATIRRVYVDQARVVVALGERIKAGSVKRPVK